MQHQERERTSRGAMAVIVAAAVVVVCCAGPLLLAAVGLTAAGGLALAGNVLGVPSVLLTVALILAAAVGVVAFVRARTRDGRTSSAVMSTAREEQRARECCTPTPRSSDREDRQR